MPLFDRPTTSMPRRWDDYSLDFKLFYAWEISLFAAIFASALVAALDPRLVIGAYGAWLVVLAGLSLRNRGARGWRWPGITRGDAVKAVGVTGAMALFFFVVFRFVPVELRSAPMIAFGLSIAVFNIASALKLVQTSDAEFAACCGERAAAPVADAPEEPTDPLWIRAVRGGYFTLFALVWLEGLAFFYFHGNFVHEGSLTPRPGRTEFITEHGGIIYLTHGQMQLNALLQTAMMVGIPLVMALGLLIHFVVGVPLFTNIASRRGIFGGR